MPFFANANSFGELLPYPEAGTFVSAVSRQGNDVSLL